MYIFVLHFFHGNKTSPIAESLDRNFVSLLVTLLMRLTLDEVLEFFLFTPFEFIQQRGRHTISRRAIACY